MGRWTYGLPVVAALLLTACGEVPPPTARSELYLEDRQTLLVADERRGRVDAYFLRNGIAWLGGVALPAGGAGWRLDRDASAAGQVWLRNADGARYLLDSRQYTLTRVDGGAPRLASGSAVQDLH